MSTHNVQSFASSLSIKLATRSRHVNIFLGAGSSCAAGLPSVVELESAVLTKFTGDLRNQLQRQLKDRSLEQALSRIRRISALLGTDSGEVDGLNGSTASDLDRAVCRAIVEVLNAIEVNSGSAEMFASWLSQTGYRLPVEIFTVNYDLLIERALELLKVPYFDGFVGNLRGQFRTDLVEATPDSDIWIPSFVLRFWKLHGSVNWTWEDGPQTNVVRLGQEVPDETPAAIFPSDEKYDDSRRVPFVVLQDRFRRALNHPESLTLVTGYSFGDEHLNEMFVEAAMQSPRSETIAFCFDDIPETIRAKARMFPNLQIVSPGVAIIGGIEGSWESNEAMPDDIWLNGQFCLGDFRHLASYLSRSSAIQDSRIPSLPPETPSQESSADAKP